MFLGAVAGKFDKYLSSDAISSANIVDIFLPLLWEQIFFSGVAMLSSWMLSIEGEAAVSAVNMINVCNMLFTSIFLAVATGGTVVVAQYVGARMPDEAAKTMQQAISAATVVAALLAAILFLNRNGVVNFLLSGAPDDVIGYALSYFFGASVSLPFYSFYQSFAGCMRGWGKTRTAMALTISINCLELAFTAIFVLGFHMSVFGIALAMIISRAIGSAIVCFYLFIHRRELDLSISDFFLPNTDILRSIMLIALPVAMEQVFFSGGKALSQRFVASYGTTHMVANSVFNIVTSLYNAPQSAFCPSILTIVGMCIGLGRIDLANDYIIKFKKLSSYIIAGFSVLFVPIAIAVCHMYGLSPEARHLAYIAFAICYIASPFLWAGSFLIPSGLRAGGDALYTSVVALSTMWGVRVALSFVFTRILHMGVNGVILAMVLEWGVRGLLFRARQKTGKWYMHKVISK